MKLFRSLIKGEMKRNPHPDLVHHRRSRWCTHLTRALNELAKLERTLVRAEKKRADEKRASETASRRARRERAAKHPAAIEAEMLYGGKQ
jgi:hypothetical protein